jgi:hypothetical protein
MLPRDSFVIITDYYEFVNTFFLKESLLTGGRINDKITQLNCSYTGWQCNLRVPLLPPDQDAEVNGGRPLAGEHDSQGDRCGRNCRI